MSTEVTEVVCAIFYESLSEYGSLLVQAVPKSPVQGPFPPWRFAQWSCLVGDSAWWFGLFLAPSQGNLEIPNHRITSYCHGLDGHTLGSQDGPRTSLDLSLGMTYTQQGYFVTTCLGISFLGIVIVWRFELII